MEAKTSSIVTRRRVLEASAAVVAAVSASPAEASFTAQAETEISALYKKLAEQTLIADRCLRAESAANDRFYAIRPRVPDALRVASIANAQPVNPLFVREGADVDGTKFLWVVAIGWESAIPYYWNNESRHFAEKNLVVAKQYDCDVEAARVAAGETSAAAASHLACHAKWETEKQILAMQAKSPADARIQLTVLRNSHEGCEYTADVVDHVIASALRVLS
ncbi:MAG: hypothetical protein CTY39_09970 [Hyphomicrobium sp.]|nr:MAG: hypothetical protein CTY39_09970 [Hyphomicrobium sp.]